MKNIWNIISTELTDLGVRKYQGHAVVIISLVWIIAVQIIESL
jgi:hypothetical protein